MVSQWTTEALRSLKNCTMIVLFVIYAHRYGISCSGDVITGVDMNDNNLVGTLPSEIGLLTSLSAKFRLRFQTSLWG